MAAWYDLVTTLFSLTGDFGEEGVANFYPFSLIARKQQQKTSFSERLFLFHVKRVFTQGHKLIIKVKDLITFSRRQLESSPLGAKLVQRLTIDHSAGGWKMHF